MLERLIENNHAEVARNYGVLTFRVWDEVTDEFSDWRAVDFDVLEVVKAMPTASDAEVASAIAGDSTHNLSEETALAIVQAVRGTGAPVVAGEPDAYAEMTVGSPVILDAHFSGELGQMRVTFWPGTQCRIVAGHSDNSGLEPAHRLWLVEFDMTDEKYRLWFRANKLGLQA